MIIHISNQLLTAIAQLETMERFRNKQTKPLTFSWAFAPEGNSADGLVFDTNGEPIKQFDVAIPNNGKVMILERPVYADFEIQWHEHPMNTFSLEI